MTHVQVAVGFGRKAGADFGGIGIALGMVAGIARCAGPFALSIGALGQIRFNDLAQKITDLVGHWGGVCRFDFFVGCAHGEILEPVRAMAGISRAIIQGYLRSDCGFNVAC